MKTNESKVFSVNHNVDEHELALFAEQVDHIAVMLGEGFTLLTSRERQRTPKPRRMMFQVVPSLVTIAERYAVEASSIAPLQAKMRFIGAMKPFADRVRVLSHLVDDMLLKAQGQAWTEARSLYMQLKGKAAANTALAKELEPVIEAFRTSRKGKAAADTTSPGAKPTATADAAKDATAAAVNGTSASGAASHAAAGEASGAGAHA